MTKQEILFSNVRAAIFTRICELYKAGVFTVEITDRTDNPVRSTLFSFGNTQVNVLLSPGWDAATVSVVCKSKSGKYNSRYDVKRESDLTRITTSIFGEKV